MKSPLTGQIKMCKKRNGEKNKTNSKLLPFSLTAPGVISKSQITVLSWESYLMVIYTQMCFSLSLLSAPPVLSQRLHLLMIRNIFKRKDVNLSISFGK